VLILCPSCRHAIRVRDLRPGRFAPRCPRCDRSFQLTVPDQPGQTPVVSTLDPSLFAEPVVLDRPTDSAVAVPEIFWPPSRTRAESRFSWPGALPRGTPRLLGGYLLLRLLGHGPRGQTFLARGLSLAVPDVLKLVAADRNADRVFLAHQVREAFAAAQIEHPNLAGIRAVGSARGRCYSVVPFLSGPALAELTREQTPLDPYLGTVVILQAARGLQAAHAQRLWHRDLKPENLRLSDDGLVKVDDLGLEMTPSLAAALEARERPAEPGRGKGKPAVAAAPMVGTPSFMPPEQASDPTAIDARADIYALGATYYTLVTGSPPFEGENAVELIRKHQEESPVPAEKLVKGLPRAISDAIRTMMGKRPEERYPSMMVVVDVLERILDLEGEDAARRLGELASEIEPAAEVLAGSPLRLVRVRILALCGLIGLACVAFLLLLGLPWPALGILGFLGLTSAAIATSSGLLYRSELLRLGVAAALGGGIWGWIILAGMAGGAIIAFLLWGGFLAWFMLICAAGLAAAYHVFLDRPWAALRAKTLEVVTAKVKELRARGFAEETIGGVIAECGGDARAELLEILLGRRSALARLARQECHHWLRRPLATAAAAARSRLARHLQESLDRRHQKLLERTEEGRLEAAGVNLLTARRRARRIGKALMVATQEWRDEQRLLRGSEPGTATPPAGPPLSERLARAASQPEPVLEPHEPQRSGWLRRLDSLGFFCFGRMTRFLLAVLLLGVFAFWLDQQGILTAAQVRGQLSSAFAVIDRAVRNADAGRLRDLSWNLSLDWRRLREPVELPLFTDLVGKGLPAANLGVAGLVLAVSILSGRKVTGFFALLGAAISLFGPRTGFALPASLTRFDAAYQSLAAGVLLLAVGFLWPRRRTG
jgi:hypothetical protein